MTTITITEALAEIKLIKNKIDKKQSFVLENLTRIKNIADPFLDKGGAPAALSAEMQSIKDLEERLTIIRNAIMRANVDTIVTIDNVSKSLYSWLVWKEDIAKQKIEFFERIYTRTKTKMDDMAKSPKLIKSGEDDKPTLVELEAVLPYMEYATHSANVKELLDKLDGILSLKNATIVIEV